MSSLEEKKNMIATEKHDEQERLDRSEIDYPEKMKDSIRNMKRLNPNTILILTLSDKSPTVTLALLAAMIVTNLELLVLFVTPE